MDSARRRRVEMFTGDQDDPRPDTPTTGDERPMLLQILRRQRATLELKYAGLEAELARRSAEPSALSLLGLVRHPSDVERRWFRQVLGGQDAPASESTGPPASDADGGPASGQRVGGSAGRPMNGSADEWVG